MPTAELLVILAGLAAALGYGAGDFSGGYAARRSDPYVVVLISGVSGLILLLLAVLLTAAPLPPTGDLLAAAIAGIFGALAVTRFYRELSRGHMGIVAPLTAVVTVTLPLLFSMLTEGLPGLNETAGMALAVAAIWMITRSAGPALVTKRDLSTILVMGFFFSIFFIVIGTVSERSVLWPLIASRAASIPLMLLIVLATARGKRPFALRQLPLIALVGLLDVSGSAFFALASSLGRLDIAAVLASLYPAATVLLARSLLKEQISGGQWLGLALALLAIILITL